MQNISYHWACGNEYTGVNAQNVKQNYGNSYSLHFLKHIKNSTKKLYYQTREQELLKKLPKRMGNLGSKEMEIWSDFSLALMSNSSKENQKLAQAIEILEKLLLQFPNEYNLHANIGTAFELQNNLEKSLFHIKKALEINPHSHKGSEWIHVKILEGKIAKNKNPNFFVENPNWLGISFVLSEENTPKMVFLDKKLEKYIEIIVKTMVERKTLEIISINKTADILFQHIGYQLTERMFFVSPEDIWVGDLLQFLGDILVNELDVEQGSLIYEEAKKYTTSNMDLLEQKIKKAKKILEIQKKETYRIIDYSKEGAFSRFVITIFILSLLILLLGVFLIFRKLRKR